MRGQPLTFNPGPTAKARAAIAWQRYEPVTEQALDEISAVRELAGPDPRPLLVWRTCPYGCDAERNLKDWFAGSDENLALTLRWYHTVQVDHRVIEPSHPLHALFGTQDVPHLLAFRPEGGDRLVMDGARTRTRLRSDLLSWLKPSYRKDPGVALSKLRTLLRRYDALESQKSEIMARLRQTDDPRKEQDLDKKLARIEAGLEAVAVQERELADLGLILPEKPALPPATLPPVPVPSGPAAERLDAEIRAVLARNEQIRYEARLAQLLRVAHSEAFKATLAALLLLGGPCSWPFLDVLYPPL